MKHRLAIRKLPTLLVAAVVAHAATAQIGRDYIRQDDEGHLILRFAGTAGAALDAEQNEEVVNAFVSVMVHDRLRADIRFEHESVDKDWAATTQQQLGRHFVADNEVDPPQIECRSASCRLVFGHTSTWRVAEHRAALDAVQGRIERALTDSPTLQHRFLLAAYYQERETPYIKAYLLRMR